MAERVAVNHYQRAPEPERKIVEQVMGDVESFESGIGQEFKDLCEKRYRQYRGFRKFRLLTSPLVPLDMIPTKGRRLSFAPSSSPMCLANAAK